MDIALDRGQQNFALGFDLATGLFGVDIGQQIGHGLFHYPGALDHLGQKHFAAAKQVPNLVHALH